MQTKKLLGSALALAMMWPGQASAELLKNLKLSGSFEVQGIRANNVEDFQTQARPTTAPPTAEARDEIADVQHRILLSLDWDLLDDVHARTTLRKNDRQYGDRPAAGRGSQSLNEVQDNVFLDEAWVKVDKVFGSMDLTMGRQFLGTPGDIIAYYGPKEKLWGMPVDALDMMRADFAGESFTVSALAGKGLHPTGVTGALRINDENDIRALLFGLRGQENIAAGAYLWNVEQHHNEANVGTGPNEAANDGGRNSRLWILGVKAKAMMGPLWIGGEFAKNYGIIREAGTTQIAPTASAVGWAALLDLGAKLDVDGVAAFTPWGKFAVGTGRQNTRENRNEDFQAVNPDFRPGIIYGRFGTGAPNGTIGAGLTNAFASNSLQNRVITGFGLKVNPAAVNKLTAGLSFWDFRRHRATFGPNTNPTNMGQKHFGSEIDLDLTWDHSDNVQFGVGAGRFMPGQYIHTDRQATTGLFASANSQRGVNPAYAGYFDVKIKWGGQQ